MYKKLLLKSCPIVLGCILLAATPVNATEFMDTEMETELETNTQETETETETTKETSTEAATETSTEAATETVTEAATETETETKVTETETETEAKVTETETEIKKTNPKKGTEKETESEMESESEAVQFQGTMELPKLTSITKTKTIRFFKKHAFVNVSEKSFLMLREAGNTHSKILEKLPAGTLVKYAKNSYNKSLSEDEKWVEVVVGDKHGFVATKYLITGTDAQNVALAAGVVKAYRKDDEAKLLIQVKELKENDVILKTDPQKTLAIKDLKFLATNVPAGQLTAALQRAETTGSLRNDIINFAQRFVGNPYVWGGTDPNTGADCSGLVQYVMAHFGISTPRIAQDQYNASKHLDANEVQPGDLVFYSDGYGISHVAIYAGGGLIIHARNSMMGIRIDPIACGGTIAGYGTYLREEE